MTVSGITSKQEVRSNETKVRILSLDIILILQKELNAAEAVP